MHPGEVHEHRIQWLDPPRVDNGDPDTVARDPLGDLQAGTRHRTHRYQENLPRRCRLGRAVEDVDRPNPLDRGDVWVDLALGEAHHRRPVGDRQRLAELGPQRGLVPRRGQCQPGYELQKGHVPHAVVGWPVLTGDTGPVQDKGDRQPVHGDVHQHLVEGSVEECRVDAHHRLEAAHGQARGGGDRMLLGDTDVEHAVGKGRGELLQTDRLQHGRGEGDDVRTLMADLDDLIGEDARPAGAAAAAGRGRLAGARVNDPDRVETVGVILLGGWIAEALAGHAVDDHRPTEVTGPPQRRLDRVDIVPVHRPHVLQTEILEHALGLDDVLDALLDPMQGVVERRTDQRGTAEHLLDDVEDLLVLGREPQGSQMIGQPTDGRGVGAPVVVDDHDHRAVRGRDVVQRFPAHAAGQRAVAHNGDDRAGLTTQRVRPGQPIGVGQGCRGVRVLDDVVR